MVKAQALSVSIIIPVFNEEDYIKPCLEAIKKQSVKPLEVIIVDNNCTDNTIAIAKRYSFVKVVKEPVQGRTVSRSKGFDSAKGDILGRIDADSIIMKDWVKRVIEDFQDPSVGGLTGLGSTRVMMGIKFYSTLWSRVYFMTIQSLHGIVSTWGANMAVRRSAWEKVKSDTAPNGLLVHEDQDVAYVLIGHRYRVIQDNKLIIRTHGGSFLYWPKFWDYTKKTFRMKKHHDDKGTLDNSKDLMVGMPRRILQGFLGGIASVIFTAYAFISWPFFKVMHHTNSQKLKEMR